MPLQKPLDSADLDQSLELYLEYSMFTKLFILQCKKYGLHIRYQHNYWELAHIGITEGQAEEVLGDYHGTAQEILTIALDLYVKVANQSA